MTLATRRWLILAVAVLALAIVWLPSARAQEPACSALSVIANIPVRSGPREVAVDPEHGRVYVANNASQSISVIDGQSLSIINEWPLNGPISAMAIDPGALRLYVAHPTGDRYTRVWLLDPETGQYTRDTWLGWQVVAMVVNSELRRLYMVGAYWRSATDYERFAAVDGEITEIVQQPELYGLTSYTHVAVDQASGTVYASHHYKYPEQSSVIGFSAQGDRIVGGIKVGGIPGALAVDSVRRRALVQDSDGVVWIVDIGTQPRSLSRFSDPAVSATPMYLDATGKQSLVVDEAAGIAYVLPEERTGLLSALDVGAARELATLPVDGARHRMGVDPATHRVYVSNEDEGTVSVIQGIADDPPCQTTGGQP